MYGLAGFELRLRLQSAYSVSRDSHRSSGKALGFALQVLRILIWLPRLLNDAQSRVLQRRKLSKLLPLLAAPRPRNLWDSVKLSSSTVTVEPVFRNHRDQWRRAYGLRGPLVTLEPDRKVETIHVLFDQCLDRTVTLLLSETSSLSMLSICCCLIQPPPSNIRSI